MLEVSFLDIQRTTDKIMHSFSDVPKLSLALMKLGSFLGIYKDYHIFSSRCPNNSEQEDAKDFPQLFDFNIFL